MAITTLDLLLAGLRPPISFYKSTYTGEAIGRYHNLFAIAGIPAAGVLGTPGLAGATVTAPDAIGGHFDWTNPAAGNAYLAKVNWNVNAAMVGVTIYDLLWYNSGLVVTTTTAQTINSIAFPARSADGTANGQQIEIYIHCQVATTNGAAITNTTYSYTNELGTAGRTGGLIPNWPATAVINHITPFGLQGGDTGVRSIQTVTLGTSYGAGTINLMAIRRVAQLGFFAANTGQNLNAFDLGMPQLFNGSALYAMNLLSGTGAGENSGHIQLAHG